MLVVGTPRPASILGEVTDNGFFESQEQEEDRDGDWDPLSDDIDGDVEDGQGRDSRTRSESFHEMYDEKAKLPPISLSGNQPLLTRQLNIVTTLNSFPVERKPHWELVSREELAEEEQLEREENIVLERWHGVGGRGKPDWSPAPIPGGVDSRKTSSARRKSNANSSSALVPSAGITEGNQELLPRYDEVVRILALAGTSHEPRMEWKTSDFSDAGGRRVHCQIWELHLDPHCGETLLDTYIRHSDAVVSFASYSETIARALQRASALDRIVVVTGAFGSNPIEAKRIVHKISPSIHFDAKGTNFTEVAARDAVLKNARLRGERKSVLIAMEKQLKRMEKGKSGGACILM